MSELNEESTSESTNNAAKVAAFAAVIATVGVGAAKAKGYVTRKRAERAEKKAAHLTVAPEE